MSKFIIILLFLATIPVFAGEDLPGGWYQVVSDEFSSELPKNSVVVRGNVIDATTETGISSAFVGTISQKKYVYTKSDGTFLLNLNTSDSTLYFYHPNYPESIIWKYEFKSQHIVTINFYAYPNAQDEYRMVEKPVIYLYSEKPLQAEIKLAKAKSLIFTYPEYKAGWNIDLNPLTGIKIGENYYPYLFWEGEMDIQFKTKDQSIEGFFIRTDSTVKFLENKLSKLGLNAKERTDFITYWAPRMLQYQYATVQFLVDEDYESQISGLEVSPKPDSQRRIYMVFQGSTIDFSPAIIKTPSYDSFVRTGFTLIEWGGTEIPAKVELHSNSSHN